MNETQFQIKFFNWLKKHGFVSFSVPNGLNVDNVINVRVNKLAGMTNGVSDMIVLRPNGRCIFLELKTEKGKQRKEQAIFQATVESLGFDYRIVRPSKDKQYWKELHAWLT